MGIENSSGLQISAHWQRTNDFRAEYLGCVGSVLKYPRECTIGRLAWLKVVASRPKARAAIRLLVE